GSKVGRLVGRRERPGLAESFDSDASHIAGEWGEAALLGMRRNPRQLEKFIGHLGIELRGRNRGSSLPSRLRKAAAQRLEPGVHLEANRITAPTLPSPASGGG